MKKRGKVLRDARSGPGLLIVEGQQYPFSLQGAWRSELPPIPGMSVEVEFGSGGEILAIRPIPASQIAKVLPESASGMVGRSVLPSLLAAGLLLLAWFFLSAVSVQTPLVKLDFTLWEVLELQASGNGFASLTSGVRGQSAGFYGIFAFVAVAGPFLHWFWKDKRAFLGGLLPLLFLAMVALSVRSSLQNSLSSDATGPLAATVKQEVSTAVSLGIGAYLSCLVSLYFAATAVWRFLKNKQSRKPEPTSRRAAA